MPEISITPTGTAIEGSVTTLNFTIQLPEAVQTAATYYFSTMDGSAVALSDFNSPLTSISFAVGERTKTLSVPLVNNTVFEADEFMFLNMFSDSAKTIQVATGVGRITDTWTAAVTTSLSDSALLNVDSLLLTGTANINGTGNFGFNRITGNTGNNVLDGGSGDDFLEGSGGADTLIGGLGNDTLSGGPGQDSLAGSSGNDLYILDNANDVFGTELSGDGTDTVQVSFNYTLPNDAFLENLTLAGSVGSGTGNDFDNVITGNAAVNVLSGDAGNDTLLGLGGNDTLNGGDGNDVMDGGTGANRLVGGIGNDIYRLNTANETIVESSSQGFDLVEVAFTYSIAAAPNLEDITLLGDGKFGATGNSSNNILTGNDSANLLVGNAGDDVINGKGGKDTLRGGDGDDVYILSENPWNFVDAVQEGLSGGADTIRINSDFKLPGNIERLELLGNGDFTGTGNALGNVITGNSGNNFLQGGQGVDILRGGLGNDTFLLEDTGDQAQEDAGFDFSSTNIDTVIVAFANSSPYVLSDSGPTQNIENILLKGVASSAVGNSKNNSLLGNDGGDALSGGSGNDTLDGDEGQDSLAGGFGADVYKVDIADSDQITEVAEAHPFGRIELKDVDGKGGLLFSDHLGDTIFLSGSGSAPVGYNMADNVELLSYSGTANLNLQANISNNLIQLHTGNDTVRGEAGNDYMNGGGGADVMIGGLGDDSYVVSEIDDVITEKNGEGSDTAVTAISYRIGTAIENLTMEGTASTTGHGNGLANVLLGNPGANILDGLDGNDNVQGGSGDDTLLGQTGNDKLNGGYDSLTGETGIDLLLGQDGNDTLISGGGVDTLRGGPGNDSYQVTGSAIVFERAGSGIDLVTSTASYTLTSDVENLVLAASAAIGVGNTLANKITGNLSANTLDGGAGIDTLTGGLGNDFYYVNSQRDVVVEDAITSSGTDQVVAAVSGYVLADNVENLTVVGPFVAGTGNTLANRIVGNTAANNLSGGSGNDLLDGLSGKDTLVGGLGDDTFVVDNIGDKTTEATSGGSDMVVSSIDYSLAANVENIALTGLLTLSGTGNTEDNVIYGNDSANVLNGNVGNDILLGNGGDDQLVGGSGNDTLTGGTGADRFNFVSNAVFSGSAFGNDFIKDFNRLDGDKIRLGKTTFKLSSPVGSSLAAGSEFASVATEAQVGTSSALVVFSQATGNLYFNSDRSVAGGDVFFATIQPLNTTIGSTDFVIG